MARRADPPRARLRDTARPRTAGGTDGRTRGPRARSKQLAVPGRRDTVAIRAGRADERRRAAPRAVPGGRPLVLAADGEPHRRAIGRQPVLRAPDCTVAS